MSPKPSRAVTRQRCVLCGDRFTARRRDARYCSGKCRQRAARARVAAGELAQEIEATRRRYWELVRLAAEARGVDMSRVVTEQAQSVDEQGNVYMGGPMGGLGAGARLVGHTTPPRPGWSTWGLEAAGPPFCPPPTTAQARLAARRQTRTHR